MSRYKPYPKYKESGVEWLSEIPEHWEVKKFKHLFRIKKRIAGRLGFDVLSITQKGIRKKDIESGEGQISSDYSKYQYVYKGDFAMNHMDLLTGFVDLSKYDGVTSPDYRVFSLIDKESQPKYYLYLLQIGYLNRIFYPYGQGASHLGRWRLPTEAFNEFLAPCPPTSEQTIIANFLERETTKIDILISKQERLIELLQEKIISVAMDEQINGEGKFERLMHLVDIIERPVKLNPQTEYTALGLYNRGRGLFHKPAKHGNEMGDSDFFYVKSGDLILSGQFAWEGAVALAKDTENGCVVSHRYPILRGKTLHTEYLLALFMTDFGNFLLNECSRGAAGRNRPLNTGLLLSEKIRVPSESTQNIIKKLVYKKFEIEQKAKKAITLLKERRTALISAAVTGKIDVREAV